MAQTNLSATVDFSGPSDGMQTAARILLTRTPGAEVSVALRGDGKVVAKVSAPGWGKVEKELETLPRPAGDPLEGLVQFYSTWLGLALAVMLEEINAGILRPK